MSYILHLDTSAEVSSASISKEGKIIATQINDEVRNHAASINDLISKVLSASAVEMQDINAVAVCSGPGSYTGLRIAMATAKGLCYALDIPLIMHDKLYMLAGSAKATESEAGTFASILVAREGEYFVGIYDTNLETVAAPQHIEAANIYDLLQSREKIHITTNENSDIFYQLKVNFLSLSTNIKIDYQFWATCAYESWVCKQFANTLSATPLYLKQVYTHK